MPYPTTDPPTHPTTDPTAGPATEPTTESTTGPATHPGTHPTTDPTTDPTAHPAAQSAATAGHASGLQPGERVLGSQTLTRHRLRKPVRWKRPKAFAGVRRQRERRAAKGLARWAELVIDPFDVLLDLLFRRPSRRYVRAPLARAFRRLKDSGALIARRRRTEADRLLCAMSPRCRVHPRLEWECTDRRLRLVYVFDYATSLAGEPTRLTEVGWEAPVHHLAWIRPRRDGPESLHEFGFTDGSWISLDLVRGRREHRWRDFIALFPPHLHVPADHNPSRNLAKSLRREWSSRRRED